MRALRELYAVHSRHQHVGDEDVDGGAEGVEHL